MPRKNIAETLPYHHPGVALDSLHSVIYALVEKTLEPWPKQHRTVEPLRDPTLCTTTDGWVRFDYDPYWEADDEDPFPSPPPAVYRVHGTHVFGWEIRLYREDGSEVVERVYLDPSFRQPDDDWAIAFRLCRDGVWTAQRPELYPEDDPMGTLADYE